MNRNPSFSSSEVFISYAFEEAEFANQLVADLQAKGLACWIDTDKIRAGDKWTPALSEAILNSYVVVVIATRKSLHSEWVQKEITWAITNKIPIIPFLREDVKKESRYFPLIDCQWVSPLADGGYKTALSKLARSLEELKQKTQALIHYGKRPRAIQRDLEQAYFQRLQTEAVNEVYTPLGGSAQQTQRIEMRPRFALMPMDDEGRLMPEILPFNDAVKVIKNMRRAVLLGEPGGGKTTTIWKLAADLVETALRDDCAPIPLLISLREWTTPNQPLVKFIAEQLGDLANDLDSLLSNRWAALLLDGLNELPVGQREAKFPEVKRFIEQHPQLMAVVSCRKDDYTIKLGFDCINITPLDPVRIREFVKRYLDSESGETLFWKLAGERARNYHADFLAKVGAEHEDVFWLADTLPANLKWTYGWDTENKYGYWPDWFNHRETPSGLLLLASNPFMLTMLASVYARRGDLPRNRGKLFQNFVENLLDRERKGKAILDAEQKELIAGLAKIAFEMQNTPATQEASPQTGKAFVGASTVMPHDRVIQILGDRLFDLAVSASILSKDEQVRFTHQLLQEYFAAKEMDTQLQAGKLKAVAIWQPDRWWERTNWEEAAILLAGLYSDDCSQVVEWVAEANPEVAAQCVVRSGAALAEATKERLRAKWIPRLTDLKHDPDPKARAAVGRALGMIPAWDNRKGVGVIERDGLKLPDIDWVRIPEGEFQYGDDGEEDNKPQRLTLPEFYISRYPVTFAQYQTFLDDPEGFNDPRWFEGLAASEEDRQMREQYFKFANHPRETVNWYQAMAFCRWLSWRKGTTYDLKKVEQWAVRLPTEFEWEKAARGTDGRLYPYGKKFGARKGNTGEDESYIGQTSAVGIFPNGASPYGVEEMSGNVLEWCLSDYNDPQFDPKKENLRKKDIRRVLRGGSWFNSQVNARAVYRDDILAAYRYLIIGFRVVLCASPFSV
ncbi:MAG: SUMF1/EgtB/PvdO family nonheme iron enzyme [Acidobacteria bacterium]|nr:SUMF1/EgtB/PvdO family nonheme iron enzyme [Acidobacteriota bacterium]